MRLRLAMPSGLVKCGAHRANVIGTKPATLPDASHRLCSASNFRRECHVCIEVSAAVMIETDRLRLRRFTLDDAAFVHELVNEPGWLKFIGDKAVHSLEDAKRYLQEGPLAMYARFGFGMYLVERKEDAMPVGMCGLVKRDGLEHVDIGFAFLARYTQRGYASEAAVATLNHARELKLSCLLAITTQDNTASQRLLQRLGLAFDREITFAPDTESLRLFRLTLD